jgi:putative hydrolase of HD superfamily
MMMADRQRRTDSDGDPPTAATAPATPAATAAASAATTTTTTTTAAVVVGGAEDGGIITAASTTAAAPSSSSAASRAIDLLTLSRNLKTTKRTGWVASGVSRPESIADHSYRLSLAAMIASRPSRGDDDVVVDAGRCVMMSIVHDLAESIVGDITPHCGVSDADKHAMELAAMERIRDVLGGGGGVGGSGTGGTTTGGTAGDEILELWREYEAGVSPESKLVKDLDKIEMILQALEYEAEGDHLRSLDGFFDGTEGKWKTEVGRAWAEEIVSRRRRRRNDNKRGGAGGGGDGDVDEGKR